MSIDETKINKLPLINLDKGESSTKNEKFQKSQSNIFLSQLRKNYYATLRSISIKKSGMNISTDNKYLKFRSTSLNINKTTILKKNKNNIIISSSEPIKLTKYCGIYKKKSNNFSKSKSKSKSKSRKAENKIKSKSLDEEMNNNTDIVEESNELKIYYYRLVKFGNDISTVKKCFEHRENWKLAPDSYKVDKINLIWAPLSCQINYSEMNKECENGTITTLMNHYEFQSQLSNKSKLFKNLLIYCEENRYDLFAFVPLTIVIEYQSSLFLNQFSRFSFIFNNINYFLAETGMPTDTKKKYRNYFYIDSNLDNKVGLKTTIYIPKTHYDGKNFWLIKAMNLNRGLAIKIVDSIEACENIIRNFYQGGIYKNVLNSEKKEEEENKDANKKIYFKLPKIIKRKGKFVRLNTNKNNNGFCLYHQIDYYTLLKNNENNIEKKNHYQSKKILLQKYIEKPLLYRGRKFDVRIWVLLTHNMKVYIFKEGHLKATSSLFSLENKNFFVHLTNYSVQKYSNDFGKKEIGNEISFDDFEKSLREEYNLEINIRKYLLKQFKKIIEVSMKSVKKIININQRKGSFEIFGYDFMLDEELNPFLLEINTNPGLEISSPLISKLIPRMIDDALRLTIDEVFGTIYKADRYGKDGYISPFHVDGYSDNENMFELVANINEK